MYNYNCNIFFIVSDNIETDASLFNIKDVNIEEELTQSDTFNKNARTGRSNESSLQSDILNEDVSILRNDSLDDILPGCNLYKDIFNQSVTDNNFIDNFDETVTFLVEEFDNSNVFSNILDFNRQSYEKSNMDNSDCNSFPKMI